MSRIEYSVFTKPWKTQPVSELGELVRGLGFDGIELPVRPGYQVEPKHVGRDLPKVARQLAECGVKIFSVAGSADEATIAACAEAGVPTIRTMGPVGADGYVATEQSIVAEYERLVPALDQAGVNIGLQNHCGKFINNALGLRAIVERFDQKHVCAVWDAAHEALNGGSPEFALEVLWPRLGMVNLKNGLWMRSNGPEAEWAEWKYYWTSGRQGLAVWPRVANELKRREYSGVVCLTAEYSDERVVDRVIREDIAFARSLLG